MRYKLPKTNSMRILAGLAMLAGTLLAGQAVAEEGPSIAGPSISGPTIAPATQPAAAPAPAATAPATRPATTQASPESVLENLLHQAPANPVIPPTTNNPKAAPAVPAAAPNAPEATRLREGQTVWNRVGRLVKDEKTGQFVFAFESDGKEMKDPPMVLLPCRMLMAMETASEEGAKAVRFKVSGQVTEYRGKNYLLVTYVQIPPDLNRF